jgi:tRNA A-37 threonylcarbamoyl transferase component Bud32
MAEPAEPLRETESEEGLPEKLSGHRILSEVGRGGMARVLLAWDEGLGREVAIKILDRRYRDDPEVRNRFMQEARALARLAHPHIVRIYELGSAEEQPHFVMELVRGTSFTEAARPLPLRQKVELLLKVVLAVDFLHEHHIVHRDLKPGNVLVGPDLEPRLLDFGLARVMDAQGRRLTASGEFMGTPQYLSPEQTEAHAAVDARSDVFSLGTMMYEVLTGTLPFHGDTMREQFEAIRSRDPMLPRRLNSAIPGDLQKICLKALEKDPALRYASAREMATDIAHFLAEEPVLAAPTSYSRLMAGRIEQHLNELEGWVRDRVISEPEYDSLRKAYERLTEREDAWIMEVRRLSLSQVSLYLGAWIIVVGAGLVFLFHYPRLVGTTSVLTVGSAAVLMGYFGLYTFRQGQLRISVAFLLAFSLLLPITLLVAMGEYGWFTALTRGDPDLEVFYLLKTPKNITHGQLWWSILLSLPAYVWLRRFTRASVYSLVFAVMAALLGLVTLLRMGAVDWVENDPGKLYFRILPIAMAFFVIAIMLERLRQASDSRYFYPVAVLFTFAALSGIAGADKSYAERLETALPWTRGHHEYLFILNAGIYYSLHTFCGAFGTRQMRTVAKSFRFVVPGHVMTSLLLLGLEATERFGDAPDDPALRAEARMFEVLLPAVACGFVFASIPKQMKNYLATGLFFLAVGIVRLQQNWLKDQWAWPVGLLLAGALVMYAAVRYPVLRLTLARWKRRRRESHPPSTRQPGASGA